MALLKLLIAMILVSVLLLLVLSVPALGQDDTGPGENILKGLRDALSFRSPAEAYATAMRVPTADDALAAMKNLSENQSDAETAAKAGIWVGLYHYGGGATREALTWFETAFKKSTGGETQARARFWAEQCRNLLEVDGTGEVYPCGSAGSIPEVLAELAIGDQELRRGKPAQALRRYLASEGDAERLGCLGPVYYRVALVLATSPSMGQGMGLNLQTVRGWEKRTPSSPERALASVFAIAIEEPAAPSDSTSGVKESNQETAPVEDTTAPSTKGEPEANPPPPPAEEKPVFTIQLGAYRDRNLARTEMERLTTRSLSVRLDLETDEGGTIYRIHLGREASREAAEALARRVCSGLEYTVVRIEGSRSGP